MTQLDLLDLRPVPPYQRHSRTSRAAAMSMAGQARTLKDAVYSYLQSRGSLGATDLEGCAALGLDGSTYRPRRVELEADGRIAPNGTRETPSGRMATVWICKGGRDAV